MSLKRNWSTQSYTDYILDTVAATTTTTMGAKHSNMTQSSKRTKRSNSNLKLNQHRAATTTKPNGHQQSLKTTTAAAPAAAPATYRPIPAEPQFNEQACQRWFEQYADPDTPNMISPEGMQRFFEDLGLSLEDVLGIVFAWKIKAETMGYITKDEWMTGMRALGADSMDKLKQKRSDLKAVVHDPNEMKDVYRYTFGYAKNKDQKCMDVDVACVLWTMMMGQQFPIVSDFVQFLQEKKPVKVINRDQWHSFLEFILTVSSDLSDYDEMSAWPVLLDEFVEWKRQGQC